MRGVEQMDDLELVLQLRELDEPVVDAVCECADVKTGICVGADARGGVELGAVDGIVEALADGEQRKRQKEKREEKGKRVETYKQAGHIRLFLEKSCVPRVGSRLGAKHYLCSRNSTLELIHGRADKSGAEQSRIGPKRHEHPSDDDKHTD